MDNYREKIIRIVERELKRTEEYQQRRDEYGNEEYILGCIMVKGDAFPKEVIAHAFVEDMGLELQFQFWRDEPRIRQKQATAKRSFLDCPCGSLYVPFWRWALL